MSGVYIATPPTKAIVKSESSDKLHYRKLSNRDIFTISFDSLQTDKYISGNLFRPQYLVYDKDDSLFLVRDKRLHDTNYLELLTLAYITLNGTEAVCLMVISDNENAMPADEIKFYAEDWWYKEQGIKYNMGEHRLERRI